MYAPHVGSKGRQAAGRHDHTHHRPAEPHRSHSSDPPGATATRVHAAGEETTYGPPWRSIVPTGEGGGGGRGERLRDWSDTVSLFQAKKQKPLTLQLKFCNTLLREIMSKKHYVSLYYYMYTDRRPKSIYSNMHLFITHLSPAAGLCLAVPPPCGLRGAQTARLLHHHQDAHGPQHHQGGRQLE